ncbi:hypothetical protein S40285_09795, partial [Stachybotrys chlorohalonatus IBT 40285]
KHI